MIQVFADDKLLYAPSINENALLGLTATVNVAKGGMAEIVMPSSHPAVGSFTSHRTVVTIYQDNELLFRGRALFPGQNLNCETTITCEGERCFLRDGVLEPYLYQADPAVIFSDIISKYNAQVEPFKQFRVGAITVTDPNGYMRMEREDAELVSDAVDSLVERVGGFITFTTDSDGQRVINWLATLDSQSGQIIEFGENLLDFSRVDSNDELATVIYPYGAKDEETGKRVNIESVNGGKRYIVDEAAKALRGWVAKPVYFDDVTLPGNLLTKARQHLAKSKLITTTLELSAVDLSAMDKSIDTMRVGDNVRVLSKPHGVDDVFLLRERTYNLLDPSQDKVVLGKEVVTLTGTNVAKDRNTSAQIRQVTPTVTNNYNIFTDGDAYSPTNPPEYPVTSVNGMTGDVKITIPSVPKAPKMEVVTATYGYMDGYGTCYHATVSSTITIGAFAFYHNTLSPDAKGFISSKFSGRSLYLRPGELDDPDWGDYGTTRQICVIYM